MIVNDNGKFCTSCNKNVIDFSSLSDAEIIKLLSNTTSNVCGRLNSQQLNRVIHPKAETQSGINKFWLSFSLTALLSNLGIVKATAQTTTKTEQLPTNNVSAKQPLSVNDSAVTKIKCVLLDSITQEPMSFTNILINELNIKGQTNFDGVFEFETSNTLNLREVELIVNSVGYTTKTFKLNLNKHNHTFIMFGNPNLPITLTMGIICTRPSLWQRIKYKFSRK
jgi:hypothetical protein